MANRAQQIIDDARSRFNKDGYYIGCTSDSTGCRAQNVIGTSSQIVSNIYTGWHNPFNAIYCAGFDVNQHWSKQRAYTCPGHRAASNTNRYIINPQIVSHSIIFASQLNQMYNNIKTEINARLKHIFYSNLEF